MNGNEFLSLCWINLSGILFDGRKSLNGTWSLCDKVLNIIITFFNQNSGREIYRVIEVRLY